MDKKTWLMRIRAANEDFDHIQGMLALLVSFGWEERELPDGRAEFIVHSDNRDFLTNVQKEIEGDVADAEAEIVKESQVDWLSAWKQFFTPVECGSRFVILPPWLAHLEHSSRKPIIIEPKSAFGTGHHASTRLCLAALSELADTGRIKKTWWFLDLGCGSGVLGIAAAKLGMDGTCLDIDPVAVANARENRELNGVSGMEVLKGDIGKVKREKFNLVMANILAQPLIDMSSQLMAAIQKDGALILSGILDTQAQAVAKAYGELGTPKIMAEDEWRALFWEKIA